MPINKINKKKNGLQGYRVRVNYTDVNGNPQQVERTAYGNAEATLLEQQLIAEFKEKRTSFSRMTIKELCQKYEVYHANETRKTSHDTTMKILTLRVLPTMGNYRIDKLTKPILEKWKNGIANTDLSIITKQNAYSTFNALLNYAVKMDYISKNPLSALGNFRDVNAAPQSSEKLHYYTPEQFLKYISVAKENSKTVMDWGYYVFFNIAFYTGARKGEINALKWSDIEGNTIHIRRSIAQKLKGDDVETPPKNKSSYRDIQMPEPLISILTEHRERQRTASKLFSDDFRVCGGEQPLRDTSIDHKNRAFAAAVDLPHIRVHDFRHSHASLLANEGINIQEVARRLGHSNVQMTWNTYSHLYPQEEERALKVLNQIKLEQK